MNNDGWITAGSGPSDMRLEGKDLQHNRQTRTADEIHVPVRMVRQQAEGGGPMKEHIDHSHHSHPMHNELSEHLEHEKDQHHHAQKHAAHHMERHHTRHHDTQHGHDGHKHHYGH